MEGMEEVPMRQQLTSRPSPKETIHFVSRRSSFVDDGLVSGNVSIHGDFGGGGIAAAAGGGGANDGSVASVAAFAAAVAVAAGVGVGMNVISGGTPSKIIADKSMSRQASQRKRSPRNRRTSESSTGPGHGVTNTVSYHILVVDDSGMSRKVSNPTPSPLIMTFDSNSNLEFKPEYEHGRC